MRTCSLTLRTAAVTAVAIVSALGTAAELHAQFTWNSSGNTDITNGANYNNGGTAPTFNGSNAMSVWTASTVDYTYTASQGTTTLGTSGTGASVLTWIAQGASNTVRVTGGTLNLAGAFANNGTEGLWVGNGGTTASLIITGGAVNVTNGTEIGRDTSVGLLSITNGTFSTGLFSSAVGTYIGAPYGNTGPGTGTLTIGSGGQFILAAVATNPFSFASTTVATGTNNPTSDFINFTTGSTGKITLNLNGATLGANYLSTLVTDGYVKINGVTTTTLSSYAINTSNLAASTLALAVPEPSTWAFFGGCGAILAGVALRRRRALV